MSLVEKKDSLKYLKEFDNLTESDCVAFLKEQSDDDLLKILDGIKLNCSLLLKENSLYKYILQEGNLDLNTTEATEIQKIGQIPLTYEEKCNFAKRKLRKLEEEFKNLNSDDMHDFKDYKQKLELAEISLKGIKEEMEYFNKNICRKHPVTKKIILQTVNKYLTESIKNKRAMANRYKMQIQSFTMESNKIQNQIKDQNKRIAALSEMKYQEVKYEHQRSREALANQREKIVLCKSKYSSLTQNIIEVKKALEEEETKLSEIKENLSKKEHMKGVMISEKSYNDQKIEKLSEAMHKIKVDPRRHELPEVIDYAAIKRKNENLKQDIKLWEKKVAVAEQAKLMHLKALKKRS